MSIATDRRTEWERNGFLTHLRIHDAAENARVRAQFDALEAVEGQEKCQIGLVDRHWDQPFIWEIAAHPRILDAVEEVMGPDIMLLATHFFCKYPRGEGEPEKFVAWHQDVTYWGLEPAFAITAWYAVDDADVENGCMRALPGTHDCIREHGKSETIGNLLSINQAVPVSAEEEARAVDMPLRAGEISLHHGTLIHGSNPNRSQRRRCGMTIRYIPPQVHQYEKNSQGRLYRAILLRGEDRFHHFGDVAPPYPLPAG